MNITVRRKAAQVKQISLQSVILMCALRYTGYQICMTFYFNQLVPPCV